MLLWQCPNVCSCSQWTALVAANAVCAQSLRISRQSQEIEKDFGGKWHHLYNYTYTPDLCTIWFRSLYVVCTVYIIWYTVYGTLRFCSDGYFWNTQETYLNVLHFNTLPHCTIIQLPGSIKCPFKHALFRWKRMLNVSCCYSVSMSFTWLWKMTKYCQLTV